MPRFFFDIHDHDTVIDDAGEDCVDVMDAKLKATAALGDMLKDADDKLKFDRPVSVEVRDEVGFAIMKIEAVATRF